MRIALGLLVLAGAILQPAAALRAFSVLVQAALVWLFARTLLPGREPLIARIARVERGTLDAELTRYTRRLTWIWTLTFLALTGASLYCAVTSNMVGLVVGYVPVAGLFFGEYAYRRWRFPNHRHETPWRVIRRIRDSGAFNL